MTQPKPSPQGVHAWPSPAGRTCWVIARYTESTRHLGGHGSRPLSHKYPPSPSLNNHSLYLRRLSLLFLSTPTLPSSSLTSSLSRQRLRKQLSQTQFFSSILFHFLRPISTLLFLSRYPLPCLALCRTSPSPAACFPSSPRLPRGLNAAESDPVPLTVTHHEQVGEHAAMG